MSVDQVGADVLHLYAVWSPHRTYTCPSIRLVPTSCTCSRGGQYDRRDVSVDQVGADVLHPGDVGDVELGSRCPSIRLVPTSCTWVLAERFYNANLCPSIRLVPTSCTDGPRYVVLQALVSVDQVGADVLHHRRDAGADRIGRVSVDQVGADVLHPPPFQTLAGTAFSHRHASMARRW